MADFRNIVRSDRWINVRRGTPTAFITHSTEPDHFLNGNSGGQGPKKPTNGTESLHPASKSAASKDSEDELFANAIEWPLHLGLPYFVFAGVGLLISPTVFTNLALPAHLAIGYAAATAVAMVEEANAPPHKNPNSTAIDDLVEERRQAHTEVHVYGVNFPWDRTAHPAVSGLAKQVAVQ